MVSVGEKVQLTMTKIESVELIFRPLQESDAEGAYPRWLNDKDVCK